MQQSWQKRAILGLEPGYGQHLAETMDANGADILMSWSLKSDVPVNYYYGFSHPGLPKERWNEACRGIACMNTLHPPNPRSFSTEALAPTFVSNCGAQPRARFLTELGKHLKLHNYGGCWHSPELPPSTGYNDNFKLEVSGKYKFHFAFENTLLDDYVSEKFFTPLKMGTTLLVVFGAPNIEDWAPAPHSIINALEYSGPAELARYLKYLDKNDTVSSSLTDYGLCLL